MNVYIRYPSNGIYYGRYRDPILRKSVLINLHTTNKADAIVLLRNRVKVRQQGLWQVVDEARVTRPPCRLAELFALYQERATCAPNTIRANLYAVKSLLRHAGCSEAENQPSTVLSRDLIGRARAALLGAAGDNYEARRSAMITSNSLRLQARSLFTKELLAAYRRAALELPSIADFLDAPAVKVPAPVYVAVPEDLMARIRTAAVELRRTDPNCYRVYLLALTTGLRRGEIEQAQWSWMATDAAGRTTITIQGRTKSGRARPVPLQAGVFLALQELRCPRVDGAPEFLLDGAENERHNQVWRRFSAWLKAQGWTRRKKAHELRKEFGSEVTRQAGISGAQDLLGHAHISTTKSYYASAVAPLVDVPY